MKLSIVIAVALMIAMVLYGIRVGELEAVSRPASCTQLAGDPTHVPNCAPVEGVEIDAWRKHSQVNCSKSEIIKQFGAPDGVWEVPYYLIPGSDETWVYEGRGQHIFVFSSGKCIAAADTFIYE